MLQEAGVNAHALLTTHQKKTLNVCSSQSDAVIFIFRDFHWLKFCELGEGKMHVIIKTKGFALRITMNTMLS